MPRFIQKNHQQTELVAINFDDQLQSGTFEHALNYLIDNLADLSVFYSRYSNDETGRPAYHPSILLKIILFAYSKGITSSREMEWCCANNIIFKALSGNSVPHFTTIASFISGRPEDMERLFEQILWVCYENGLLGNELFAIDGCKMSSDAAKTWSGTHKELREKRAKLKRLIRYHVKKHKERDATEVDYEDVQARAEQTIETLTRSYNKVDEFIKCNEPRMGKGKVKREVKSNITDNESAKMTTSKGTLQGYNGVATVDKQNQIIVNAQAFGEGQEHHVLQPVLEEVKETFQRLGISDDIFYEGTMVTADTGYANEANMQYLYESDIDAYIPDNQFRSRDPKFAKQKKKYGKRHQHIKRNRGIIPAGEFKLNAKKKSCVCPAGEKLFLKNEMYDAHGNYKLFFEGRMSKCRHCLLKHDCMKNPSSADTREGHGRQVSFIVEARQPEESYTDWMKARVDSEYGKQIYAHRMSVVEPVFANIGVNKKLNRFSLRGKKKVQAQWQLYCMVHNIEKLANYGELRA